MKMARCIVELERIYGIREGSAGKGKVLEGNNSSPKSQGDLAKQLEIDKRTISNYKKLNTLIPELQDLVETGNLKATTAYKIWAKLPQEEYGKIVSF